MRLWFSMIGAAACGSLFTFWLVDGRDATQAVAQPPDLFNPPVLPAPQKKAPTREIAQRQPQPTLLPDEHAGVRVYERANRSVVNITTKTRKGDIFRLVEYVNEGTGSGVVIDKDGHILTNYHVVEKAGAVEVTLHNGKSYEARFVGGDQINDLAVIRIGAPKDVLEPVVFGDSARLKVGLRVFAIGNPFGLERTMTTGIISSLNRSLAVRSGRTIRSIIQIDAAVNPGNSGGPLLDAKGNVIGINVAIATKTGQSAGVGFAIPSNTVTRISRELIKHGRFIRPEAGIRRVYETKKGLRIAELDPRGPAARAGLRGPVVRRIRRGPLIIESKDRSAADLIVKVDDVDTRTADDFLSYVEGKRAGETVALTVVREGKAIRVPVRLERGE